MLLTYKDGAHAYYIDGARCKSVTTLAKLPDDSFHLERWKQRQVAIGLAKSPHLLESVAAHHTDKGRLNDLVEKAMQAAGVDVASESGSTAHRVTERIDRGEEILETPAALRIAEIWQEALAKHRLEVVSDLCERVVCYPDELVAGQFDRMLRRADGTLVLADLKTGKNVIDYPHSISIQMGLYANAPLMAAEWEGKDGSTEDFEPLPAELDKKIGVIIHMVADKVTLYEINIAAGYRCAREIILPTLAWRKRSKLTRPMVADG